MFKRQRLSIRNFDQNFDRGFEQVLKFLAFHGRSLSRGHSFCFISHIFYLDLAFSFFLAVVAGIEAITRILEQQPFINCGFLSWCGFPVRSGFLGHIRQTWPNISIMAPCEPQIMPALEGSLPYSLNLLLLLTMNGGRNSILAESFSFKPTTK